VVDAIAANVPAIVRQVEASGVTGHQAIAVALNAGGVRAVRGRDRHATTVPTLLARAVAGRGQVEADA